MKKIVIFLILFSAITLQAENIEQGSMWYNGAIVYHASNLNGNVVMNAMVEGEELEFMLVPETGKPDTYRVTAGPNDGYFVYDEGMTIRHLQQEGLDVLCLYDTSGNLYRLLSKTDEWDNQPLNEDHWMEMIRGTYTMQDGTRVTIDRTKANIGGYYITVKPVTFNGLTTNLINFDENETPLNGTLEVVPTISGLELHPVDFDDYGFWHRLPVDSIVLTESDPNQGRFDFAREMLLYGNDIYDYNLTMLRLMRNGILAHHGYAFQTQDLQEYFQCEPWYKAGDNNEDIKTSLLEQLNNEIIKYREKELTAEQKE
ncbi:MAG: YARHG domain-containing protein [Muribaculaceae bacterium]|nr:YARHG domain-containing protein [Muribaculaceae bacterium]